jgi:hypothetical protein
MFTASKVLYITSYTFELATFTADFRAAYKRAATHTSTKVSNTGYLINAPTIKGEPSKYCYVWIDNVEVINILRGRNPNGSERVEYAEDDETFDSTNWASGTKKVALPALVTMPDEYMVQLYNGKLGTTNKLFCPNLSLSITKKHIQAAIERFDPSIKIDLHTAKTGQHCRLTFGKSMTEDTILECSEAAVMCRRLLIKDQLVSFTYDRR